MAKYSQKNPRQFLLSIGVVAILGLWVGSIPESISAEGGGEESTYTGPKVRVAIGELKDLTGPSTSFARDGDLCRVPVTTAGDLLKTALVQAGRFDVVEPHRGEEGFEAVRSGAAEGFEYLITGAVNDWRFEPGVAEGEIGPGRFGALSATVAMSFRVADTKTGQILFATSEQAEIGLRNTDRGRPTGRPGSDEMSAALRSAIELCTRNGADRLVGWFGNRPWTGTVSAVEHDQIYIGAGSHQGLREGMTLSALSTGRRLIDPETGLVLGSVTEESGRLRTVEVREQESIAAVVDGCDGIRPGDRVELHL